MAKILDKAALVQFSARETLSRSDAARSQSWRASWLSRTGQEPAKQVRKGDASSFVADASEQKQATAGCECGA